MCDLNKPVWEKCDMCDDFICNVHQSHVYDCECPGIEFWVDHEVWPYDLTVDEYNELAKTIDFTDYNEDE